jgi:Holliday junction resolvasome RuvABC DNA-binding subunit
VKTAEKLMAEVKGKMPDDRTEKRRRESMERVAPSKTMKDRMHTATCVPGNSKENR